MGDRRAISEDELNQYWNSLLGGSHGVAAVPVSLDVATVETLRWLANFEATPSPAASRERVQRGIREQLRLLPLTDFERNATTPPALPRPPQAHQLPDLASRIQGPFGVERGPSSASSSNGRVAHVGTNGNGWISGSLASPRTSSWHPLVAQAGVLTRIAAALILVIAIAGAMVVLFYPLRIAQRGEGASREESNTLTLETASTGEKTLFDLTLTEMPTHRTQLGIFIVTLPPGARAEQRTGTGPQVFYVAEGPVTVRARTAPEPLQVTPPNSEGLHSPKALIAEGEEATIETGTSFLAPAGAVFDQFTTGSTAARLLDLLSAPDAKGAGDGVSVQFASNGGMIVDVALPVSVSLRQERLAPAATLPAPASNATRQVVAPLDKTAMGDLRSGTGGSVLNAGKEPVDLYVLTVTTKVVAAQDESG